MSTYTHLSAEPRWGDCVLIEDVDAIVRSMREAWNAQQDADPATLEAEFRADLQPVEPVSLMDGRRAWRTEAGAVYLAEAGGAARYHAEWGELARQGLSAICDEIVGDTLVTNDRGNGSGGPGAEDATGVITAIAREEREDEAVTLVAEVDDAAAWELARDAFRSLGLDPATVRCVAVGERAEGDNGHQTIYCW